MSTGDRPHADDGEVKEALAAIRADVGEIKAQVRITNGRVSALERWRAYVIGAVSALLLILGSYGALLFTLLRETTR